MKWRLRAETQPLIEDEEGRFVANTTDLNTARQIVLEHNGHAPMLSGIEEAMNECFGTDYLLSVLEKARNAGIGED